MTSLRRQIAESLSDKDYRDALVRQNVGRWFSAQLRATREGQGLKQAELGKIAGMGQASISELETPGRRQPSLDTILRLASALDVAALVELVPYHRFVNHVASAPYTSPGISPETMNVVSYDYDAPLEAMLSWDDGATRQPQVHSPFAVEPDLEQDKAEGEKWDTGQEGLAKNRIEFDKAA